jgi:ADP-ribose pyrophosphatase YjhB (NUDIX family)
MEEQETPVQGAMREAWEEAMAKIEIDRLLAVYAVPRISQVQLIFRAHLASADFAPGTESLETKLFAWEEIPWDELAFPSVHWALKHNREVEGRHDFAPFDNPR